MRRLINSMLMLPKVNLFASFLSRRNAARVFAVIVCALLCVAHSASQSSAIDAKLAGQYFQQLQQTSARDAGKTWGRSLYGPIFFVDPETHTVVANQADKEQKLVLRDGVFVGKLPNEISPANTAINWAGVHWTMVMWPVPEFRQA